MKKRANKAEREYMTKVAELGCIICERPAEIHHVKDGFGIGQRAPHIGGVIPLCPEHHRSGGYGMAFHAGKAEWQRIHGTEARMLEKVTEALA